MTGFFLFWKTDKWKTDKHPMRDFNAYDASPAWAEPLAAWPYRARRQAANSLVSDCTLRTENHRTQELTELI